MNIVIITSTPFPPEEGIGYYAYNLSNKLKEKGHEVIIITRGSIKHEEFIYENIKVVKLPFLPIYPFHVKIHGFFVNRYLTKIKNEIDVLNIHTPLTPVPKINLPIVSTIHGSMIKNAKEIEIIDLRSMGNKILTRIVTYSLVKKLINKSVTVTTVSKQVKKELEQYYSAKNVKVVFNGIDEKKFFPNSQIKKENYFLYVGRLSYGKGIFDLIEVAKMFKDSEIKFLLVGDGELKAKIKKSIKKNDLEDKVVLLGKMNNEDLVEIYQKAIAFIFPSYYEGFPTVVLEAMSSGLPIVLTDIDAHKNFIENNINGLFFKKGSIEDLNEKLSQVLENESLRRKLSKNAREKSLLFTWNKITEHYISLFEEAAN